MSNRVDDPFDLERFVLAQESTFEIALAEIRAGEQEIPLDVVYLSATAWSRPERNGPSIWDHEF